MSDKHETCANKLCGAVAKTQKTQFWKGHTPHIVRLIGLKWETQM